MDNKRILALDIGDRRIGVAVSSPSNTFALPLETYERKKLAEDIAYVVRTCEEKGAGLVVCGLPVNLDGSISVQTKRAEVFINKLREAGLEVETTDERLTTVAAEETLIESDKSRSERKKYVDSVAASYILDDYINNNKNKNLL